MTIDQFIQLLQNSPLVASVQADPGTPLATPEILRELARTSLNNGARILRMQGTQNISAAEKLGAPIIGLIKREYPDSLVYITPTSKEVDELLKTKSPIIAIDGTKRNRPNGQTLRALIEQIHSAGRLALADIDCLESATFAIESGADILSTTLSGYTSQPTPTAPDLELVRQLNTLKAPVLAEGRYAEPWQAQAACLAGAIGVVIGGVLNDPIKQTRKFHSALSSTSETVGAIDLGGTWLRFATLQPNGELTHFTKIPAPKTHQERLDFIRTQAQRHSVTRIGISAGGTINPATATVTEAKGFIPDYVNQSFSIPGLQIIALNDGLATAWGHALHPNYCGKTIATIALGTGVGAGIAHISHLFTDIHGNYPRWNDLPVQISQSVEELLGGLNLTTTPSIEVQKVALQVAQHLITIHNNLFIDSIVLCGGVANAPWFQNHINQFDSRTPLQTSPIADQAGIYGAAMLAKCPPPNISFKTNSDS